MRHHGMAQKANPAPWWLPGAGVRLGLALSGVRRETMPHPGGPVTALCALVCLIYGAFLVAPPLSLAHPLGNFSISHYAGLRLTREGIELRYVLDMAEIPTFLERQETGLVPEVGHPSLRGYLDRLTEVLPDWLRVEVHV